VHPLDSWIKRDQLDVTCFIISLFNAQHVSDVNTSILRSLRLICWVLSWVVLLWFDVCWCYVVVWLGPAHCRFHKRVNCPNVKQTNSVQAIPTGLTVNICRSWHWSLLVRLNTYCYKLGSKHYFSVTTGEVGVRIPIETRRPESGGHPASKYTISHWPSTAEVNNDWSYTTPPCTPSRCGKWNFYRQFVYLIVDKYQALAHMHRHGEGKGHPEQATKAHRGGRGIALLIP